jgi:hypothetical protein
MNKTYLKQWSGRIRKGKVAGVSGKLFFFRKEQLAIPFTDSIKRG